MKTGWLDLNGTWYYLDGSGAMVTGSRTINGKTNLFSKSGVWQGLDKIDELFTKWAQPESARQNGSSWSTPNAARSAYSMARKATGICSA